MPNKDSPEVFNALALAEANALTEASLNRIFQHIDSGEPFALITPFVSNSGDPKDPNMICVKRWGIKHDAHLENKNRKNLKELKGLVQGMGLGYIRTVGHFTKATGEKVQEPALFVIGISAEDAHKLGNKYCQQSVLWGDMGEGVFFIDYAGKRERISSKVSPQTFKYGWTEWKRRAFSFREAALVCDCGTMSDHRSYMQAVDSILDREYGSDKLSAALRYVAASGSMTEALDILRGDKGASDGKEEGQ